MCLTGAVISIYFETTETYNSNKGKVEGPLQRSVTIRCAGYSPACFVLSMTESQMCSSFAVGGRTPRSPERDECKLTCISNIKTR
jgi:hypothetical protein